MKTGGFNGNLNITLSYNAIFNSDSRNAKLGWGTFCVYRYRQEKLSKLPCSLNVCHAKDFYQIHWGLTILNLQSQNFLNANKFVAHMGELIGSSEFNTIGILR